MRKLNLLLTTLVFSLTMMFASTSYAKWTWVDANVKGTNFYLDFTRIRKVDGYVYFWRLDDWSKPHEGLLSYKAYVQGDCELVRYKYSSFSVHKEPMGKGIGKTYTPPDKWKYPPPDSSNETILKLVCEDGN